ncbi:hypothetical protein Xsze_00421 [Xenorhabdus szentirmaii DSM 16338]|nr:hypothetical protein Xsze_00421 [Xenorhabdus szentirmaii DSM 16338]
MLSFCRSSLRAQHGDDMLPVQSLIAQDERLINRDVV